MGSLESTQEARVDHGYVSVEQLSRFSRALQTKSERLGGGRIKPFCGKAAPLSDVSTL